MLVLVLLVLAALLLLIFHQRAERAYWIGLALFAWYHGVLLTYSWGLDPNTSRDNLLWPDDLVTSRRSARRHKRIYWSHPPRYVGTAAGRLWDGSFGAAGGILDRLCESGP
jgi:hypothetical protein